MTQPSEKERYSSIVLISRCELGILPVALRHWLGGLMIDIPVRIATFDQVLSESSLEKNAHRQRRINVIIVPGELGNGRFSLADANRIDLPQNFSIDVLAAEDNGDTNFLCVFPLTPSAIDVDQVNLALPGDTTLFQHGPKFSKVRCIDYEYLESTYSIKNRYRPLSQESRYSDEFLSSAAIAITRQLCGLLWNPYKVIVVDCDNTLWRGECAANGYTDGAVIDESAKRLQEFLLAKVDEGFLLCLCSKNEEKDVLDMFSRPDMLLSLKHTITHRINWQPKSQNIKAIARELKLSIDSFIFLDDEAFECEEVRFSCPGVFSSRVPQNHNDLESMLLHLWPCDRNFVTAEDRIRTRLYRTQLDRDAEQVSSNSETFLETLQLTTSFEKADRSDLPRVSQLSHRAHVFNSSARGFSVGELLRYIADGGYILCLTARDRFGDYGLVGAVLINNEPRALTVDAAFLSCRALGKGIEPQLLSHLASMSISQSAKDLEFLFQPTARNAAFEHFLRKFATPSTGDRFTCPIGTLLDGSVLENKPYGFRFKTIGFHTSTAEASSVTSSNDASVTNLEHSRRVRALEGLTSVWTGDMAVQNLGKQVGIEDQKIGLVVKPRTPTEMEIFKIWKALLNLDEISVFDDLFDVVADSLLAIQILAAVRRRFQVELPVTVLFQQAFTISVLAEFVELQQISLASPDEIQSALDLVSGLSESEVRAMLFGKAHEKS